MSDIIKPIKNSSKTVAWEYYFNKEVSMLCIEMLIFSKQIHISYFIKIGQF